MPMALQWPIILEITLGVMSKGLERFQGDAGMIYVFRVGIARIKLKQTIK